MLFSWLFSRTGGSLPLAILLHIGAHANNTQASLPGDAGPAIVGIVSLSLLVVGLLIFDRQAFRAAA